MKSMETNNAHNRLHWEFLTANRIPSHMASPYIEKIQWRFSKLSKTSQSSSSVSRSTLDISEMRSVGLSNTDFIANTNSSGIDCKCSANPIPDYPCEPGRDSKLFEEVVQLRQQVADLKQAMVHIEAAVQSKDEQLDGLHHDNERVLSELKKQQRCNRNLKQQLDDERFFYQKEKEHFCEEMQNHTMCKRVSSSSKSLHLRQKEFEKAQENLQEENKALREELIEKSETTYNLCIKFLRMKHAKDTLRQKLYQLMKEHLQVMTEMMEKFDEAREELNTIVSEKFQDPVHLSKTKFLQVVQRNSRLVHENAALKLQSHQLTQSIEKLKSEAQKTRTINVDERIIAKLASQGRRKRREDTPETSSMMSCKKTTDKQATPRSSLSTIRGPSVDSSGDAKAPSQQRIKRATFDIPEVEEPPEKLSELRTERTQSAPEIVQTATFMQDLVSGNLSEYTDVTEHRVEVRDMYTNT